MSQFIRYLQEAPHQGVFTANELPDLPLPTITLHRETVVRFRNDYAILVQFAAHVCGVEPGKLNLSHLIKHVARASK